MGCPRGLPRNQSTVRDSRLGAGLTQPIGFRVIRQPLQHWASHSAGSRRESELVGGADHLYFSSRRDVLVLLTKGVSLGVIA